MPIDSKLQITDPSLRSCTVQCSGQNISGGSNAHGNLQLHLEDHYILLAFRSTSLHTHLFCEHTHLHRHSCWSEIKSDNSDQHGCGDNQQVASNGPSSLIRDILRMHTQGFTLKRLRNSAGPPWSTGCCLGVSSQTTTKRKSASSQITLTKVYHTLDCFKTALLDYIIPLKWYKHTYYLHSS